MQLTDRQLSKQCAAPLFEAYKLPLSQNQNVTVNLKGLINSIALSIELAPPTAWSEPLHVSGLFSVLLKHLAEEKASHEFPVFLS